MELKQVIIRVTGIMKRTIWHHAKEEGKSVTKYIADVHLEHCKNKRNKKTKIVDCPNCGVRLQK